MAVDLNGAAPQREFGALIPDGTFVHLVAKVIHGGKSLPPSGDPIRDQLDQGLFVAGKADPEGRGLNLEHTVLDGPHKQGKIWDNYLTISGGATDEHGNSKGWLITKSRLMAMINSALGLMPTDESQQAKDQRVLRGFADIDGIEYWAKIGVEAGTEGYADKNTIALVIEPDRPEYAALRAGQEVAPQPRGTRSSGGGGRATSAAAPASSGPAWRTAAAQTSAAAPTASQALAATTQPATAPAGPKWLRAAG
jgi:hypothetical protein